MSTTSRGAALLGVCALSVAFYRLQSRIPLLFGATLVCTGLVAAKTEGRIKAMSLGVISSWMIALGVAKGIQACRQVSTRNLMQLAPGMMSGLLSVGVAFPLANEALKHGQRHWEGRPGGWYPWIMVRSIYKRKWQEVRDNRWEVLGVVGSLCSKVSPETLLRPELLRSLGRWAPGAIKVALSECLSSGQATPDLIDQVIVGTSEEALPAADLSELLKGYGRQSSSEAITERRKDPADYARDNNDDLQLPGGLPLGGYGKLLFFLVLSVPLATAIRHVKWAPKCFGAGFVGAMLPAIFLVSAASRRVEAEAARRLAAQAPAGSLEKAHWELSATKNHYAQPINGFALANRMTVSAWPAIQAMLLLSVVASAELSWRLGRLGSVVNGACAAFVSADLAAGVEDALVDNEPLIDSVKSLREREYQGKAAIRGAVTFMRSALKALQSRR